MPVEPEDDPAPPCLSLRTKMHYVMTLVGNANRLPTGEDDDFAEATDRFYCQRTMQGFGPDDDLVAPRWCQPERACYESSGF